MINLSKEEITKTLNKMLEKAPLYKNPTNFIANKKIINEIKRQDVWDKKLFTPEGLNLIRSKK